MEAVWLDTSVTSPPWLNWTSMGQNQLFLLWILPRYFIVVIGKTAKTLTFIPPVCEFDFSKDIIWYLHFDWFNFIWQCPQVPPWCHRDFWRLKGTPVSMQTRCAYPLIDQCTFWLFPHLSYYSWCYSRHRGSGISPVPENTLGEVPSTGLLPCTAVLWVRDDSLYLSP